MRVSRLLELARPRRQLPPKSAYELWAPTYPPRAHNPLMRLEQQVVERVLGGVRATRALDVGTGSGRYVPLLATTGAAVLGIDFSLAMLGQNRSRARVCGDACRLPFPCSAFDLVNASLMVGDVGDIGAWAREMARVLVLGGHLVYSDFHPAWAERGWRRTFQAADGRSVDVAYVSRSVDEHLTALQQAGLQVIAIREPRFKDDEDPAVQAFRRRWDNAPVVVVFHAVKLDAVQVYPAASAAFRRGWW